MPSLLTFVIVTKVKARKDGPPEPPESELGAREGKNDLASNLTSRLRQTPAAASCDIRSRAFLLQLHIFLCSYLRSQGQGKERWDCFLELVWYRSIIFHFKLPLVMGNQWKRGAHIALILVGRRRFCRKDAG